MIRYQLTCEQGDRFEAWFRGSEDYETQASAGLIICPECGSSEISKALMTPAVRTSRGRRVATLEPQPTPARERGETVPLAAGPDPSIAEAVEVIRKVTRHVRDNADNVGRRFPEEARKIHYREVEPRNIYGEAIPAEAKELLEEGVDFHPMPLLPEDQN
jgi:hypothetical protein